ncbi:uncharacterized protein E0L32_004032 [Thyridium curvatum]|uniref:Uncharacterized protein n=1 Tax=Thyridium curvatum TaxID=1093900 RepID=A0A507B9U7_9PEZI|nr:uncharacterized protein E0L32_004032 [Thyridium curvatum]TPX16383.1 hypothetical protein E0L32_004032 [Thyridium curvatum]
MDFGSPPLLALRLGKDISLVIASKIADASNSNKKTMTSDPAQTMAATAAAAKMTMMSGDDVPPQRVHYGFLARSGLAISPPPAHPSPPARSYGALRDGGVGDEALVRHFDATPASPSSAIPETLREQLEAILANDDWTSIGGYRIGYFQDCDGRPGDADTEATILITLSRRKSDSRARMTRPWPPLTKALRRNDDSLAGVAIEITNGEVQPAASAVEQLHCVKDITDQYASSPLPGASVGASQLGMGSATLGGYFRAVIDDETIFLALVCHHAISRHEEPITCPASGPIVCSPSDEDHSSHLQLLKDLGASGYVSPDHRSQIEDLVLRLDGHDRVLGKVICSSGMGRCRDGYLMDWALVKVYPERMPASMDQHLQGLRHCMITPVLEHLGERKTYFNDQTSYDGVLLRRPVEGAMYSTEEALAMEIDHKRHAPVVKSGRTTKTTTGSWHRIEPSITVTHETPGGLFLARGRALSIFGRHGRGQWFADKGDSGALVYDYRLRYLGHIVATDKLCPGPHSLSVPMPMALVSPMVVILRDVKESLAQAFGATKVEIEPFA